jgi:hypothetical protein
VRPLVAAVLAAGTLAGLALVPEAGAQSSPCLGDTTADGVPQEPGPLVRFGLTPAGEAGALGPPVEPVPDDPPRTLEALNRLRARKTALVLRLNRFFWSDGEAGIQRFLTLVDRYTSHGFPVELQLRYHPAAGHEGDVAGFVAWVREVVDRFGSNPGVVGLQVTNEVNLTISPDSSDGAYAGARDALIQGVIAAKDEARRRGYHQVTVGFNWFFRTDPSNEESFWNYLRDHGGDAFLAAVDWVGLDVYPGTVFPPVESPGGERDGMVAAMSSLRRCWMPRVGLADAVPIHVEENGWPTGPGRGEDHQVEALRLMVGAVHDFRGTYNVSDYRWFDLRDHNTASSNFQHHYGLLRDDYSPKPAFAAYRDLIRQLAREEPEAGGGRGGRLRPRLALRVRDRVTRRGRAARLCARGPVRVTVVGPDVGRVRHALFYAGRRWAGRDRRVPFARTLRFAGGGVVRIRAVLLVRGWGRFQLARGIRLCPG